MRKYQRTIPIKPMTQSIFQINNHNVPGNKKLPTWLSIKSDIPNNVNTAREYIENHFFLEAGIFAM